MPLGAWGFKSPLRHWGRRPLYVRVPVACVSRSARTRLDSIVGKIVRGVERNWSTHTPASSQRDRCADDDERREQPECEVRQSDRACPSCGRRRARNGREVDANWRRVLGWAQVVDQLDAVPEVVIAHEEAGTVDDPIGASGVRDERSPIHAAADATNSDGTALFVLGTRPAVSVGLRDRQRKDFSALPREVSEVEWRCETDCHRQFAPTWTSRGVTVTSVTGSALPLAGRTNRKAQEADAAATASRTRRDPTTSLSRIRVGDAALCAGGTRSHSETPVPGTRLRASALRHCALKPRQTRECCSSPNRLPGCGCTSGCGRHGVGISSTACSRGWGT